jgi:asparagine synthase (glutamine-hydrolysing)
MSGFVVGFGSPSREEIGAMIARVLHRGPNHSGIWEQGNVLMAQNYLAADAPEAEAGAEVPVPQPEGKPWRACCDSQIGNNLELSLCCDLQPGPFQDERLLLRMFEMQGSDMLSFLGDAVFAFVLSDGERLFAARDLLGIKTLFYGMKNGTLYLTSELKSLAMITDDVHEFPPGHIMDEFGTLEPFASLDVPSPDEKLNDPKQAAEKVRDIVLHSVLARVDFLRPTAGLLSGGLDSSVVCGVTSEHCRSKFGDRARLRTFAVGVGESEDVRMARLMAGHLETDHHELIVDLDEVLSVLPEVIYHLESFDPSLVRSAVSNFLVSRYARQHDVEVLLSGEGGDEVFCGYAYLKDVPAADLAAEQVRCLSFLHNNASLRLDRMNQCHSIRVVAPLISGDLLNFALRMPPDFKIREVGGKPMEKWIFRKAFEDFLPAEVIWRGKQEFSEGSGSAALLPRYFEETIGDEEFEDVRKEHPILRSKEELFYFRIFGNHFGRGAAVDTVGQWVRL